MVPEISLLVYDTDPGSFFGAVLKIHASVIMDAKKTLLRFQIFHKYLKYHFGGRMEPKNKLRSITFFIDAPIYEALAVASRHYDRPISSIVRAVVRAMLLNPGLQGVKHERNR